MAASKQEHHLWAGEKPVASRKVNRMNGAPPQLLMVPFPQPPHIVPMLSLAKQIVAHGGITISFVCHQTLIDRLLKAESNSSDAIHFVGVPDDLPGFDLPEGVPLRKTIQDSLDLGHCMGPYVDNLLQGQDSLQGPTSMITDIFNWWTIDVAVKLSIPRYALSVTRSVMLLQFACCPPEGYVFAEDELKKIPGLPALQNSHLITSCRADFPLRKEVLTRWPKSVVASDDGVLLNSCMSIESEIIDALQSTLPPSMPLLLPIGPQGVTPGVLQSVVSLEGLKVLDDETQIKWLNEQPLLSVLYVSFGTTGLYKATKRHVKELAKGLEDSGQRFLWAFQAPPDVDENDPELLPPGFEERVKGRGLLLRGWAPQLKILAHPSTGAFLSSCGWNSSIESLALGVPIIGWPAFADQPLNCRHMEVTLKVAITLPFGADYFVTAEDFSKAINVMLQSEEGAAMRERARSYRSQIAADLAPGGSSHEALRQFLNLVKHHPMST